MRMLPCLSGVFCGAALLLFRLHGAAATRDEPASVGIGDGRAALPK